MDEPDIASPTTDEGVEVLPSNEEKLRELLSTMRASIEQSTSPQFKTFWDAREQCIPLFKEGIHPAVRSLLWEQFRDLSKEARMLSDLLGEQAAFAGEQIGIAVDAIEGEMEGIEALKAGLDSLTLPLESRVLEREVKRFQPLQHELILYGRWTERIVGLRKELIATEMRIREKNGLFKRLSSLGDRAFPRRKELSEEISKLFLGVVERFVSAHFSDEGYQAPFYVVKNEIKALQAFAKTLTLTSKAFKQTRISLSECWDRVRASEKEKRDQVREQQEKDRGLAKELMQKVAAAKDALKGSELQQALDKITSALREAGLGKDGFKRVHTEIASVRNAIADEAKQAEEAFAKESHRRAALLREKIEDLLEEGKRLTGDELAKRREGLMSEIGESEITAHDKKGLEGRLGQVADLIVDAEENAFLSTPDDHPEALSRLQIVLERKKRRRSGIKERLEELRKEAGGSSLDFEVALRIDALTKEEKGRLSHLDEAIAEIEARLKALHN